MSKKWLIYITLAVGAFLIWQAWKEYQAAQNRLTPQQATSVVNTALFGFDPLTGAKS